MPAFECCFFFGFYFVYILPAIFLRWGFLRSGLVWSLIDLRRHRCILEHFNTECRFLIFSLAFEALMLNTICAILTLQFDVGGVVKHWSPTSRSMLALAFVFNAAGHFVSMCTVKMLPLLLRIVCDMLVEDMCCFQKEVDTLVTSSWSGGDGSSKNLLEELHSQENWLRIRVAAANKTMEPVLFFVTASQLLMIAGMTLLLVRGVMNKMTIVINCIFAFLALQHSGWLVSVLHGTARVGDRWHHIVDDLNTPALCSSTAAVLGGVPLAERLSQLRYMGIVLAEWTITSSTVTSVTFTLASGLFLTALGILIQ
eukprot:gnl/TRDRNA2_/TRDRNA2_74797_c0_seq1.p1 gnl/TRDRNA2_/TRDRNA2_74797_c0~~gnl/TRDRNA2_/TRDRNA2_74797_c0_seq1.p1  ORF type:complete len:343 (-),score=54.22 gnl/TRDRNA2_/TRDRNA2_74797_c0_seq1:5-940(-)